MESIQSPSLSYADDLKLMGIFNQDLAMSTLLQQDLNILMEWSRIWSMELNLLKCITMYLGKNRTKFGYQLSDSNVTHTLCESNLERDLGVMISSDLKWNRQCSAAAAKANSILGQIKNSFSYLDRETIVPLYTSLVRPHLEYAVSVWSPSLKSDIDTLERVQRRATKLVSSIRDFSYEDRLKALNLMSLEDRRLRGDLIQMFKIVNRIENIKFVKGVNFSSSLSRNLRRSNDMRLVREINKRGRHRYHFLSNRVVNVWNELSTNAISSKNVNEFKASIDEEVFGVKRRNDCNGSFRAKRVNALV